MSLLHFRSLSGISRYSLASAVFAPLLFAQETPVVAASELRPAPEERLSQTQSNTRLIEPSEIEVARNSNTERSPEMRLLAQATTPDPTPPSPSTNPAPPSADADPSSPGGRGPGGRGPGGPGGPGFGPPTGEAGSDPALDGSLRFEGDRVVLQFPNNPVIDLLSIYERLTGMTLIKDTSIFEGATISLSTPTSVERAEAVRLIESALLTNGYAIVIDPGGRSARILPARNQSSSAVQFSHGVSLYQSPKDLPSGETIVSYFMPLDNLAPADAATILANHVGLSVYGRITPVTTPPGLLITESATIVRQLVSIREAIDSASSSSSIITRFIPLLHADAAVVAQIVQATVSAQAQEKETKGLTTLRGSQVSDGRGSSGEQEKSRSGGETSQPRTSSSRDSNSSPSAAQIVPTLTAQVVADSRLNQILVVATPEDFTYISSLIAEFDKSLELEEPYERRLNYASAVDILPALVDVLQETSGGTTQLPGGGSLTGRGGQAQASTSSQLLGGVRSATTRGGQITSTGGAAGDLEAGAATSAIGSRPDIIQGPTEDNAPVSVLIDKTRIVADPMANAILIMGRKEKIAKVDSLIDKLDRKPAQVYLATVIGQLTLGEGMETGIDYIQRFARSGEDFGFSSSLINRRSDIVSGNSITDMRDNLITSAFGPANGFNFYGAIGESVDVFVNALETTSRFKVLSRPTVFALNNKKAVITSGKLIPVPAQSTTFVGQAANQSNVTTTIEYRDVVLKLEVVPLINADGEVNLTIAQINDTVVGQQRVEPNDIPIIGTEQLVTSVTVPDGRTIVLGGLISEEKKRDSSGLPYVSRIPLLGKLFRQDLDDAVRRELIIFIQPTVVTDENSLFNASRNEDFRTGIGADASQRFPEKVDIELPRINETELADPRPGILSRLFRRTPRDAVRPLR